MHRSKAEVVICGAGIAGISAAYHLVVEHGIRNVVLVDERPPLSLTSDKSTECYRNWWPGPGDAMVGLMNRSIDILERLARESGNRFHLNRRGYLFASADPARVPELERAALEAQELGAGPLRCHSTHSPRSDYRPSPAQGFEGQPTGSDLLLDPTLIARHFPYLASETVAVLHARRCGWLSAQQLGMYLLERARDHGLEFRMGRVTGVETSGGRVHSVVLDSEGRSWSLPTRSFVAAAGPFTKEAAGMVGVDLPLFSELHLKAAFSDFLRVLSRDAPLLIWADPTHLSWSEDERNTLEASPETRWLLDEFPPGVHARPEGGCDSNTVLILWTYDTTPVEPSFPLEIDPRYPEVTLRGLPAMIPGMKRYLARAPKPMVDGGYYTKTEENRPLIGPLPVDGAYVIGALSGFGIMAGCAAGELLAAHVTNAPLPHYASVFLFERYQDPEYRRLLKNWPATGQL